MSNQAMPPIVPLLELRNRALSDSGGRANLRLLETAQCDPDTICFQIETGCYGKPFIIEDSGTRRLHFSLDLVQSAMRLDDPYALEFAYTRKMMAFLLFVPKPAHVLMVGLGGGSLAKFCHRYLPGTRLTVVEINPDVIALRAEFQVPNDKRLVIIHADAAAYLPATEGDTDVLLLDGFDSKGIAPTFLNRDFYQAARRRLRPGGVLVANFAESRKHWSKHQAMLDEAFAGQVHWGTVPGGGNHIAFAFVDAGGELSWKRLEERAEALADQFPLNFSTIVNSLREGSKLSWAKATSSKQAPPFLKQVIQTCRKFTTI